MKKEIELKYRLANEKDFNFFIRYLESNPPQQKIILQQENYFFDSPNLALRKAGVSLRLRRQNKHYFLCAKQSLPNKRAKDHLSVRLEYEVLVDNEKAQLLKQGLLSPIDVYKNCKSKNPEEHSTHQKLLKSIMAAKAPGLQVIGTFRNKRTVLKKKLLDKNFAFEIDHTNYPGNVEIFEVEVEFSSEIEVKKYKPILEKIFHFLKIKTYQSSSKSSRLFKILFPK